MSRRKYINFQQHHMGFGIGRGEPGTIKCPHCKKEIFLEAESLGDGDTIALYYSNKETRAHIRYKKWSKKLRKS